MSRTFMSLPHLEVAPEQIRVSDRTGDLGTAIVTIARDCNLHLDNAELARKLADTFAEAAAMLEAHGPDKFCAACGHALPDHRETCPRRPA